jgi:hypothetical protein
MRYYLLPALVVFAVAHPWFARIIGPTYDHRTHLLFAFDVMRGVEMPPHPLYHVAVLVCSGFKFSAAAGAASFLLALAVSVRTWITARVLGDGWFPPIAMTAICLALALAMPLPNWWGAGVLVGQPSPNVWHNPTFVFDMPFCLAAFLFGTRLLEVPTVGLAALTGLFLGLSLLAKPNYALAFLPCFGPAVLLALARDVRAHGLSARTAFGILLAAFGPAALVLGRQAVWARTNATVLWLPLHAWHKHSPDVPASILLGTAFPLAVLLCYPRRASAERSVILAWATLGVAVALAACLSEAAGSSEFNWGWGLHMADAVLFVWSTAFLVRQPGGWRRPACLGVLGLHALSGIVYLIRY